MREIEGKRGSGAIWLERLGGGTPVLWCGDADGERGVYECYIASIILENLFCTKSFNLILTVFTLVI